MNKYHDSHTSEVSFAIKDIREILVCNSYEYDNERPMLLVRINDDPRLIRVSYSPALHDCCRNDNGFFDSLILTEDYFIILHTGADSIRKYEKNLAKSSKVKVFKHYKNATPEQFREEYLRHSEKLAVCEF